MLYVTNSLMVFGWGKKKEEKQRMEAAPLEKEIHLSDVKNIVEEIKTLREKTLISETKSFKNKISSQLDALLKIAKKLEKDDLKMDDVDKHLQILVRRGKNQVISTIKNETSVQIIFLEECNEFFIIFSFVPVDVFLRIWDDILSKFKTSSIVFNSVNLTDVSFLMVEIT